MFVFREAFLVCIHRSRRILGLLPYWSAVNFPRVTMYTDRKFGALAMHPLQLPPFCRYQVPYIPNRPFSPFSSWKTMSRLARRQCKPGWHGSRTRHHAGQTQGRRTGSDLFLSPPRYEAGQKAQAASSNLSRKHVRIKSDETGRPRAKADRSERLFFETNEMCWEIWPVASQVYGRRPPEVKLRTVLTRRRATELLTLSSFIVSAIRSARLWCASICRCRSAARRASASFSRRMLSSSKRRSSFFSSASLT